jgi:hypothetical protein
MSEETRTALLNLDWLIYHQQARLDMKSNAVWIPGDEDIPSVLVEDLCVAGLTPATAQ